MIALFASLALVCTGIGSRAETETSTVVSPYGSGPLGQVQTDSVRRFGEHLRVEIEGDGGRIEVPRSIRPTFSSGSSDGWWPIADLRVTDREITGRFSLNLFEKPTIRIDRITGAMQLAGRGGVGFSGSCVPDDLGKRKF